MGNKKKLIALCLVAVLGLAGAAYWWQVARFQESTDNAYLQSDIVYISAKQAGYAEAGWINDNQKVHEGEILARIDSTDYQLKIDEAAAKVSASEAAIHQLQSQRQLQESLIQVAHAQLLAARADQDLASADLKRIQRLYRKGATAKENLDNALAADHKSAANVQGASANLESSQRQLAVIDSKINAAQATLKQDNSRLAIARQSMAETVITAPRDGIIGQRQIKDGQLVNAGSVLFSLVDSDTVWVTANFKETQVGHMVVGQPVELNIDAFPGQPITGYIDSLWPASGARFSLLPPENATGNFTKIVQRIPVKIVIPADQPLAGRLKAGMSVVVNVDTRAKAIDLDKQTFTSNNLSSPRSIHQVAGY